MENNTKGSHKGHTMTSLLWSSLFRSYYIMGMMAITFLNLIGIPMEIAFLDGDSGLAWEGFNIFSDTLFLIDVALNFRMGIIRDDAEVTGCTSIHNLDSYNPCADKHVQSSPAPAAIQHIHQRLD